MGSHKREASFWLRRGKKMNTTILNLQWTPSFSAIQCWSLSSHGCRQTLTCLRLAWIRFALWWTGGARAERKAETLPKAQTPEESVRRLYPDRKRRVQGEHRMAASTIRVWSVQSIALEGKGGFSPPNYCLFWHLSLHFKHHCWQTKFPMFLVKVPKAISER